MAGVCPPAVVSMVNSLLQSDLPMLEKMQQLTKTLKANNLAWTQDIAPSACLVHPSNRAGQMLSVEDVWSKGVRIVSLGAQKNLLQGSVCIEVSHDVARKTEQLDANRRLVALSHGQLAPVRGDERFLTLGTSHTTAFFKAVEAGCQSGDASVHIKQLEDVLSGWPWLVLSSLVEQACPGVPLFYQLASNASASGQKQISEVEACGLMAMRVKSGASLESAVAELKQADPACRGSLDAICHYVSRYGGKSFGTLMIGTEVMKLKTAAMRETLDSFEILVKDSWELCSSAQVTGASLERVFGKLCVRATLFVLGKDGKDKGGMDKHFADLPEIACAFASELKKGKTETSVSKGSQAASSTGSSSVTNVLECKPEEVALMQNSHMQLGGMYTNVKEHGNKIFVFLKTEKVFVHFGLLVKWRKFKGQPPALCPPAMQELKMVHDSSGVLDEYNKAQMQQLLLDSAWMKKVEAHDLAFTSFPAMVHVMKAFKKVGDLELWPWGTVSKVRAGKPVPKRLLAKGYGCDWLIQPFKSLNQADFTKMPSEEGEGVLCPFFWVRETKDAEAANMMLHVFKKNGNAFPTLRNKRPIEMYETLLYCEEEQQEEAKPKKKAKKE
ncbi:unnamed protein product [Symbiodinium necroappetens]|uniref:Uncharacterized protein n=1 Tax=Symbiodinium necroappetens TaxID=1628268 RepID=A0A812J328_9DINO|nr:unnamed protein product [Symbiodinium necroappetens]